MVSHFLFLGAEKRVGFGSPVGTKRWYFIKLLDCPVAENQGLRYLIVVHKRFLLNSHAGNTGSNLVGTTIKSITASTNNFQKASIRSSPDLLPFSQSSWIDPKAFGKAFWVNPRVLRVVSNLSVVMVTFLVFPNRASA